MDIDDWVNFAESGNQQKITLRDLTVLQGWIMEVHEEGLVFSTGDDKNAKDYPLDFNQVNSNELYFYDAACQGWLKYMAK